MPRKNKVLATGFLLMNVEGDPYRFNNDDGLGNYIVDCHEKTSGWATKVKVNIIRADPSTPRMKGRVKR